jgi:acid phosphatase
MPYRVGEAATMVLAVAGILFIMSATLPPDVRNRRATPRPVATTAMALSVPHPPPRLRSDVLWLRGTQGRLVRADGCAVLPSVGSWRVRCGCPANGDDAPRTVRANFSSAVAARAVRCVAGCSDAAVGPIRLTPDGAAAATGSASVWTVRWTAKQLRDTPACVRRDAAADIEFDVGVAPDAALATQSRMCFASVGDWGKPTPAMRRVAAALAAAVRDDVRIKFIVSTGDNFYPDGVTSVEDPKFETAFEAPFNASVLREMRWYMSAGNHDQGGLDAQLRYGDAHPRWYFPNRTYSDLVPVLPTRDGAATTADMKLFVLDSFGADLGGQLAAMRRAFPRPRRAAAPYRVVVNHAPIHSGNKKHHGAVKNPFVPARDALLRHLEDARVDAYLSGHDHVLEVHEESGIAMFVSGGGGGSGVFPSIKLPTTKFYTPNATLGFMVHCVGADGMLTDVRDDTGAIIFRHSLRKQP